MDVLACTTAKEDDGEANCYCTGASEPARRVSDACLGGPAVDEHSRLLPQIRTGDIIHLCSSLGAQPSILETQRLWLPPAAAAGVDGVRQRERDGVRGRGFRPSTAIATEEGGAVVKEGRQLAYERGLGNMRCGIW